MSTGIRMRLSRSSFYLTKSVLGILPERMIETTEVALRRAEEEGKKDSHGEDPALTKKH